MRFGKADNAFQRFVMRTKYLRYVAKKVHFRYTSAVDQDTRIVLRFGTDDHWVASEIFDSRPYERYFAPEAGKLVVDAGANIGCFTLRSAGLVGNSGRVILVKNTRLNDLKNVLALNFGLGEKEREIQLWLHNKSVFDSTIKVERNDVKPLGVERVQIKELDDVLEGLEIDKLDFLKLDTEGTELGILKGATRSLNRFHPKIAGEAHPGWSDSGAALLEYLKTFNYKGKVEPSPIKEAEFFYAW